ncbi:MAG: hypothetical protein ABWX68_03380 [Arthrobacter sp.]|uniref:hypothetical protein n=1 Tax=Arthrobacter sp. TaxID=1667 RepID=UPI003482E4A5
MNQPSGASGRRRDRKTGAAGRGLETPRPRSGSAEAWAESPLQLLGAIEAHGAGLLGDATVIFPRGGTAGMETALGALVDHLPPGVSVADRGFEAPRVGQTGADRWVTGDAYSGAVQRALLAPLSVGEVVVVDDGSAALDLLCALTANRRTPLVRARAAGPARTALGLAGWYRLRHLAHRGRLLVVTALPVPPDTASRFRGLGGRLEHHRFEWLDTQPVRGSFNDPTIVVGSALAADGLLDEAAYLAWIVSLTDDGPVSYLAHRREGRRFLDLLASQPRVAVHRYTVPAEMRLRGLRRGQTVHALPSSAVPALRLLLDPHGVEVRLTDIPGDWWTAAAGVREGSGPPARSGRTRP